MQLFNGRRRKRYLSSIEEEEDASHWIEIISRKLRQSLARVRLLVGKRVQFITYLC